MPLYALWETGSDRQIVLYGLHCLAGDMLIGTSALVLALLAFGNPAWPAAGYTRVAAWTVLFGLSYTAWSEWYNVQVKASWAYSDWMPLLPGFEIGLSPLAQWLVVPCVGLWWARRSRR